MKTKPLPPPTIGDLLESPSVDGFIAYCVQRDCHHQTALSKAKVAAMGFSADAPFPSIATSGRLVCSRCKGRRVDFRASFRYRPNNAAD